MEREQLVHALQREEHHFSAQQMDTFYQFLENVERLGTPLGLTDAVGDALIDDHLLDSLRALSLIKNLRLNSLADVGSGAGFLGIVLAIACPEIQVTLIERMQKRAQFLVMMQMKLKLKNLMVIHDDVRNIKKRFDAITFRALTTIEPALVQILLNISPRLLAYKGRKDVVTTEVELLQSKGYHCEVVALSSLSLAKERHLLIVEP
ncbi:16S rRNA (guanine(527)-N(7))-methyltransferase RsmG [Entomospira entomophila]|uniref:Ribosomal RNA small subunit methyltransferase G n=1 Tax=Entomospira entomophila TaxID=2719988 RepID=A0A968GCR5_9SPIO|nr:16S rRNA (guanine(527)-N(7))-methyltransferase RsmG [Entomospira entomophilus]NIZ41213.1 16S rRNA (guanine(527)-N(7))-methyltransferase RsmG [Entomospira entomophilus]WDI35419.1 16S rRNA (guanine(527)-N(7))-methyltransferase RsmG [Entomospira entomophilus]